MDLIINQMMQFQIMHVSNRYRAVEELSGTSIAQTNLTISGTVSYTHLDVYKRQAIYH